MIANTQRFHVPFVRDRCRHLAVAVFHLQCNGLFYEARIIAGESKIGSVDNLRDWCQLQYEMVDMLTTLNIHCSKYKLEQQDVPVPGLIRFAVEMLNDDAMYDVHAKLWSDDVENRWLDTLALLERIPGSVRTGDTHRQPAHVRGICVDHGFFMVRDCWPAMRALGSVASPEPDFTCLDSPERLRQVVDSIVIWCNELAPPKRESGSRSRTPEPTTEQIEAVANVVMALRPETLDPKRADIQQLQDEAVVFARTSNGKFKTPKPETLRRNTASEEEIAYLIGDGRQGRRVELNA